jgi:peptide/nickel transport system ATP-binding protein
LNSGAEHTADDCIIKVSELKKYFDTRRGFIDALFGRPAPQIKAVDGVSFQIRRGEVLGLAGESGCGKTTTGMTCVRLYEPSAGSITFEGDDISHHRGEKLLNFRRRAQMVFQDPYESLNPRFTTYMSVCEPLNIHGIRDRDDQIERVATALLRAELRPPENFFDRFPHELSGGQRQRVAIARALVLEPLFLIADEPVSMLDVSIRAGILKLFSHLTSEMGLAGLYISHDLSLIRYVCDRTAIMYLGRIVEIGPTEAVIQKPHHPYAKALLAGVSVPDPRYQRQRVILPGEVPNPKNIPSGCRFHPRCSISRDRCTQEDPSLQKIEDGVMVACPWWDR